MKNLSTKLSDFFKVHRSFIVEMFCIPVLLGGIFLLHFKFYFWGEYVTGRFGDSFFRDNPIFYYLSNHLKQGVYPYWIHSADLPFYHSQFFDISYPFYFLKSNLYSSPLQTALTISNITFLHLYLLLLNTYILLRTLKIQISIAVFGSLLLALSPGVISWSVWITTFSQYAWMPLSIAGIYLILSGRYWLGFIIGTISISLSILASPVALAFFPFIIFLLYVVRMCTLFTAKQYATIFQINKWLFICSIFCLAISSPSLLSSTLAIKDYIRWTHVGTVIGWEKLPLEAITYGQRNLHDLINLVFPHKAIPSPGNSYFGVIPLFFSLLGLLYYRRNWVIPAFGIISIYTIYASTGLNYGAAHLTYHIPLLNKIRETGFFCLFFLLSLTVLACFGLDQYFKSKNNDRSFSKFFICVLMVGYLFLLSIVAYMDRAVVHVIPTTYALISIVLVMIVAQVFYKKKSSRLAIIPIALLALVLHAQHPKIKPFHPIKHSQIFQKNSVEFHNILKFIKTKEGTSYNRIVLEYDQAYHNVQLGTLGLYYDLRFFENNYSPRPYPQFKAFFNKYRIKNYYPLMGGEFYICKECKHVDPDHYTLYKKIDDFKVFKAKKVFPRYIAIANSNSFYLSWKEFYSLLTKSTDIFNKAFFPITEKVHVENWISNSDTLIDLEIIVNEESPNLIDVLIHTDQKSVFVVNEFLSEDWAAMINGKPARIFEVNLNQMGILLDKGEGHVQFEYRPIHHIRFLALQKITVIFFVAIILFQWIRKNFNISYILKCGHSLKLL